MINKLPGCRKEKKLRGERQSLSRKADLGYGYQKKSLSGMSMVHNTRVCSIEISVPLERMLR